MPPTIEQVIAAIPDWAGRQVTSRTHPGRADEHELPGRGGRDAVLRADPRAPRPSCSPWTAGTSSTTRWRRRPSGVGPRVAHSLPEWDVFVLDWVPATTMSIETLGAPGMPTRLAETLRRLHAGPRFRDDFDMFRLSERYLALVDERDIPIPAGYREHLTLLPRIEAALARHPLAPVPCHNDLLADNVLSRRDAALDRGLRVQRHERPGLRAREHVPGARLRRRPRSPSCARAYFGEATPALLARMRLQIDHVGRRLDAVGGHPGPHLDDRLRLRWLGRGTLGARDRDARRPRLRRLAGRRLTVPHPHRARHAGSTRPRRDPVAARWRWWWPRS